MYVAFNSVSPNKKQRGTCGGKGRGKIQKVTLESMENTSDGEEDIVKDLKLSDIE